MNSYDVYDYAFNKVGQVLAEDAETALSKAKKKYPMTIAPMVELTPEPSDPQPRRGVLRNK